jgi:hypothetical protein
MGLRFEKGHEPGHLGNHSRGGKTVANDNLQGHAAGTAAGNELARLVVELPAEVGAQEEFRLVCRSRGDFEEAKPPDEIGAEVSCEIDFSADSISGRGMVVAKSKVGLGPVGGPSAPDEDARRRSSADSAHQFRRWH